MNKNPIRNWKKTKKKQKKQIRIKVTLKTLIHKETSHLICNVTQVTGFYILHIVLKCLLPTLNKFSQMLTLSTYLLIYWERISHVDFEKICKKDCVLIFTSSKKIVIIPCNGWEKHISTICLAMTRRDYLWKINNSAKRFMVHLK